MFTLILALVAASGGAYADFKFGVVSHVFAAYASLRASVGALIAKLHPAKAVPTPAPVPQVSPAQAAANINALQGSERAVMLTSLQQQAAAGDANAQAVLAELAKLNPTG